MKRLLRNLLKAWVPGRYRLPLAYWHQRLKGGIESEILLARQWRRGGAIAVDIGANSGLYSYELSRWYERIEAFEPNVDVNQSIRNWGKKNVHLRSIGISSSAKRGILHVPISPTGVEYAGWGTLHGNSIAHLGSLRTRTVELVSLDSLELANVAFIKIDVEGHEQDVLEGARQTIRRWRPVVLVEVKPPSQRYVLDYFQNLKHQLYYLDGNDLKPVLAAWQAGQWPRENVFAIPEPIETVQLP